MNRLDEFIKKMYSLKYFMGLPVRKNHLFSSHESRNVSYRPDILAPSLKMDFMANFSLVQPLSQQDKFHLTTLEAALEHIKTLKISTDQGMN